MSKKIEIKIVDDRLKELPKRATSGAAAFDIKPMISSPVTLAPNEVVLFSTGFAMSMNDTGMAAILLPRSGKGHTGLVLGNLVGLIDSDYTQPVYISLWNRTDEDFIIEPDTYVAQMTFVPIVNCELELVDNFTVATNRGGFGSTVK